MLVLRVCLRCVHSEPCAVLLHALSHATAFAACVAFVACVIACVIACIVLAALRILWCVGACMCVYMRVSDPMYGHACVHECIGLRRPFASSLSDSIQTTSPIQMATRVGPLTSGFGPSLQHTKCSQRQARPLLLPSRVG